MTIPPILSRTSEPARTTHDALPHARAADALARRASHARHAPSAYVYGARPRTGWLLRSATAASAALLLGAGVARFVGRKRARAALDGRKRARAALDAHAPPEERAARKLHQGSSLLSFSVLADSSLEHYRGKFANRAMYIAPSVALASMATSLSAQRPSRRLRPLRIGVFVSALLTGLVGAGFHIYNVKKQTGGLRRRPRAFNWMNLFYSAPLGAPVTISLAGLYGLSAEALRNKQRDQGRTRPRKGLLGLKKGRALAWLTSLGLFGTALEVWLLHFRGAFQNPFMYVPVTVPPLAAGALAVHAASPSQSTQRAAHALLLSTAATGFAGVGFHAYGIQRNMGGFYNLSQMILQGPPLPAPPAFTGLAVAGLGALELSEDA